MTMVNVTDRIDLTYMWKYLQIGLKGKHKIYNMCGLKYSGALRIIPCFLVNDFLEERDERMRLSRQNKNQVKNKRLSISFILKFV
jgi:hypothetical protein